MVTARKNPLLTRFNKHRSLLPHPILLGLAFAAGLVGLAICVLVFLVGSHPLIFISLGVMVVGSVFLLFLCPTFIAPCVTFWMAREARGEPYQLLYLSEMSDAKLVRSYVRAVLYECRILVLILIIASPTLLMIWVDANRSFVAGTVPIAIPCTLTEDVCRARSMVSYEAEVNRVITTQFPEWIVVFSASVIDQIGVNIAAIVIGVAVGLKSRGSTTPIISVLVTWAVVVCLAMGMLGLLSSIRDVVQGAIQMVISGNAQPSHVGQLLLLLAASALFPFIVAFAMFGLAGRWARQPSNS